MRQLYYRDLRQRLGKLEAQHAELEPEATVWVGLDGIPNRIFDITMGVFWDYEFDGLLPFELYHYANPRARRLLEARREEANRKEAHRTAAPAPITVAAQHKRNEKR